MCVCTYILIKQLKILDFAKTTVAITKQSKIQTRLEKE